jgi:hypothetical protein
VLKWRSRAVEYHSVQYEGASRPTPFTRLIALFAAVVFVAAAAVALPGRRAGAVVASSGGVGDRYGFATGGDILWDRTPAQQAAELDAMANTGARWVRFDFNWDTIQAGGPGSWSWSQTDRLVAAAQARNLKVLAVLLYTPTWARKAACATNHACPPADPNAFATFARAAANRYGYGVSAWEVWNEPNWDPFWAGGVSAAAYVALLKPTYVAIKSVLPATTVVSGGLAPYGDLAQTATNPRVALEHPVNYLNAMYAAGARGYFDALGHHPYAYPYAPTGCCIGWNAVLFTQTLHVVMAAHGDGNKKIWGTEAGAPTAGQGAISEAQQADWIRQYFQLWNSWSFTGPLMFFTLRDLGTNPSDMEDHFGLMRTDLTPKPAYTTLTQLIASASGLGQVAGASGTSAFIKVALPSESVASVPGGGYYVLSTNGRVEAFGGAPYFGSPVFPGPLARGIVAMPDGNGYAVVDAFGGVHTYGSARSLPHPTAYWRGWDIVRGIAITSDGRGYEVLDGWGGLHPAGDAPRLSPGWWKGWDIARSVQITPDRRGVYTLDGFGGIHTAGTARYRGTAYWRGWDIARSLVLSASGNGYAMLDGFGTLHVFGDAPRAVPPGWNHADTWRGVTLRTS